MKPVNLVRLMAIAGIALLSSTAIITPAMAITTGGIQCQVTFYPGSPPQCGRSCQGPGEKNDVSPAPAPEGEDPYTAESCCTALSQGVQGGNIPA